MMFVTFNLQFLTSIQYRSYSLDFRFSINFSSLRLIFPEIVLGNSFTYSMERGYLYGAVELITCCCNSLVSSSDEVYPETRITKAFGTSPLVGSGTPITAASITAGCSTNADSTSKGP